jgi:hypothetical protein
LAGAIALPLDVQKRCRLNVVVRVHGAIGSV